MGAGGRADAGRDRGGVLLEVGQLAAEAHRHIWERFEEGAQQRLERVLRDELIGLEGLPVVARGDFGFGASDRRVRKMRDRRAGHGWRQENVHRRVARQAGIADFFGDAEAAVDFHRAGVAALHFGELDRGFVAFDQRAAHAALAEVERQRQADGAGADDQDIGFRHGICGDGLHGLAVRGNVRAALRAFCKPPVYRMLRLRGSLDGAGAFLPEPGERTGGQWNTVNSLTCRLLALSEGTRGMLGIFSRGRVLAACTAYDFRRDKRRHREPSCPNCACSDVRRSHRRNVFERYLLRAMGVAPYRCSECQGRFYARSRARELKKAAQQRQVIRAAYFCCW